MVAAGMLVQAAAAAVIGSNEATSVILELYMHYVGHLAAI
jgi:hypothetical protein